MFQSLYIETLFICTFFPLRPFQVNDDAIEYSFGTSGITQGSIILDTKSISDWNWHNITLTRQGKTVNFLLDGSGSSKKFDRFPHDFAGLDVSIMSLGGTSESLIVDGKELSGKYILGVVFSSHLLLLWGQFCYSGIFYFCQFLHIRVGILSFGGDVFRL